MKAVPVGMMTGKSERPASIPADQTLGHAAVDLPVVIGPAVSGNHDHATAFILRNVNDCFDRRTDFDLQSNVHATRLLLQLKKSIPATPENRRISIEFVAITIAVRTVFGTNHMQDEKFGRLMLGDGTRNLQSNESIVRKISRNENAIHGEILIGDEPSRMEVDTTWQLD